MEPFMHGDVALFNTGTAHLVHARQNGAVHLHGQYMSPADARQLAEALESAADYIQGEPEPPAEPDDLMPLWEDEQ